MTEAISLPVLPLKGMALFPFTMMPITVGRPASVAAIEAALTGEEKALAVFPQRDPSVEAPGEDDLFAFGTRAVVKQMARVPNGMQVVLLGIDRIKLESLDTTGPHLVAQVESAPVEEEEGMEVQALKQELTDLAARYLTQAQSQSQIDFNHLASQIEKPLHLVYLLAMTLSLDAEKSEALLRTSSLIELMRLMHRYLTYETQVLELRQHIASQAQSELSREQRDYVLRQQLRAIQQELGEHNPEEAATAELRRRLDEAQVPEEVRKEADRELSRLEQIPPASAEYQVARAYLELILELPWNQQTEDRLDLDHARKVLDEDHYGLEEIKERIIEHLAVLKLNPKAQAPILCFLGPPGVGKTSLGQSIARALGRKFERFSLGGLHDEAELRGHRRTYIGAMPGRVIQAIRRAGVVNPLIMLDEVDKLGRDFRGDPAAALMEILDPAQNSAFRDNYLDLPFDLSRVFFVTTANTTDSIPGPLLDRMELLRLSGYSVDEKLQIAKRYLLPRRLQDAGLSEEQLILTDETLLGVINRYTREAGVRELERMLGRIARKIAVRFADGKSDSVTVTPDHLSDLLGREKFFLEEARKSLPPGVAVGLAWTQAGGDIMYVEALRLPGKNYHLTMTGQLGNVMRESGKAALSYILAHADVLGVKEPVGDVHVHVPAGAVPKDGPSAGVTIATAIATLLTDCPARNDTAMTGEITLSGLVLPVGGIKEKVLAAHRAGIRRIILPMQNEADLRQLPQTVRDDMEFIPVERIADVFVAAVPELAGQLRVEEFV